mgnify:CR=1 FL=1
MADEKGDELENSRKKVVCIETYYLIDYENVHGDGLSGCKNLGKTDHIVIFYTQNAKKIDMSDISNHGDAELKMKEVPAGKQSVDMNIASYFGYIVGQSRKNCNVVIVSKDKDYDNVVKFWNEIGITVSRRQQIKSETSPKITNKVSGTKKTKLYQEVRQAVISAGYAASEANIVAKIAKSFYGDEHMLSEVHNELRKRYTDYLDVYAAAKPVLSKYAYDNQS